MCRLLCLLELIKVTFLLSFLFSSFHIFGRNEKVKSIKSASWEMRFFFLIVLYVQTKVESCAKRSLSFQDRQMCRLKRDNEWNENKVILFSFLFFPVLARGYLSLDLWDCFSTLSSNVEEVENNKQKQEWILAFVVRMEDDPFERRRPWMRKNSSSSHWTESIERERKTQMLSQRN